MRLLLAIFLPPVVFFTIGRPIAGIICRGGVLPGRDDVHAVAVGCGRGEGAGGSGGGVGCRSLGGEGTAGGGGEVAEGHIRWYGWLHVLRFVFEQVHATLYFSGAL